MSIENNSFNDDKMEVKSSIPPAQISQIESQLLSSNSINTSKFSLNVKESKKILSTFKEKISNYPKFLSYDGSIVLSVILSTNKHPKVNISTLPDEDRKLIFDTIPKSFENIKNFKVSFDEMNDFILVFQVHHLSNDASNFNNDIAKEFILTLFNSVIHSPPLDKINTEVSIKQDSEKINVGGVINLNKETIRRVVNSSEIKREYPNPIKIEDFSMKKPSGKNAFEIRSDVLSLAVNYSGREDICYLYNTPESLLDLARKFYAFVENKR